MVFGGPGIEHITFASPASENIVISWSRDIRCIFIGLGSKYIDFRGPGTNKKYCLLVVQGKKILISGGLKVLIISVPWTENVVSWWSWDRPYCFSVIRGQKILIFGGLGTESIDFRWSRDRKYCFYVMLGQRSLLLAVWGRQIMVFGGPGTENIVFRRSKDRKNDLW